MSSVNEASPHIYEAIPSDIPPDAPHMNEHSIPAQFNVNDSPLGYNAPSAPLGYNAPSAALGCNAPSAPLGYNAPSAPLGYNAPAAPLGYNAPSAPLGYNAPAAPTMWKVPTIAPQWSLATVIPQIPESSAFYQTFLKGKPKAVGILMIVAAIVQVALGIGLFFTTLSISLPSGIPFWGPAIYIIAGSLTIAAKAKPNICLVKGSLALTILTSVFSIIGLILTCVDLHIVWCFSRHSCRSRVIGGYFIDSILIVTNLLLFCSSVSVSVFGCRSLNHASSIVPQVFVIQNDVVISMPPSVFSATAPAFPQPQQPPPPYMIQERKLKLDQ